MQHRYHINVFWYPDDDCWIADVPDLKPCSAHGDTPAEALAEAEVAGDRHAVDPQLGSVDEIERQVRGKRGHERAHLRTLEVGMATPYPPIGGVHRDQSRQQVEHFSTVPC